MVSRIGTTSNLPSGGTYDILMIDYIDGFPEGQLKFNFTNTPRKVSGIQKVGQLFLKILFTTKGSDILNPQRGTYFPTFTIGANRKVAPAIMASNISQCITDATAQTKAILSSSKDASSRLRKVDLLGLDAGAESLVVYLAIETDDGQYAQVSVPFPNLGLA